MPDSAFQIQYRQEFISGFEIGQSLLRAAVTTESVIKGNTATFLVADSGGATAVTRGINGLIPSRPDNLTQTSATLAEWHDKVLKTGFNVFSSQGDQRRIMQMTTMGVINRKMDDAIITELNTATLTTGAVATASLAMVVRAQTILGNNEVMVEDEENMFAVVSPAFRAYLLQVNAFTSKDYVMMQPLVGPARRMLRWAGVNWIFHPNLPGNGTSSERCFMYHRSAIGHAVNKADIQSVIGYDEENDYTFARATVFMGAKLLQNIGVVRMGHDGSAMAAV